MRFLLLDIIRSIAIVLVIAAHIGQAIESPLGLFFGIKDFYFISLGGIGVTIFLILSGLTLELNYGTKELNFSRFIAKRLLRILPVYYISLILGIGVFIGKHIYYTGDISKIFLVCNPFDFVGTITGFYAFMGLWGGPFLPTSWFIGLIITMYVLYPTISKSMRHHPNTTIFFLLIISTFSRLILGKYELLAGRPLDWFPLCRVFEFSLGIYLVGVIKSSLWVSCNKYERTGPIFRLISGISFPLFLVHYPLLHIMMYFVQNEFSTILCIAVFVLISVFISWIIFSFDVRVPRKFVMGILFRDEANWPEGERIIRYPKSSKLSC